MCISHCNNNSVFFYITGGVITQIANQNRLVLRNIDIQDVYYPNQYCSFLVRVVRDAESNLQWHIFTVKPQYHLLLISAGALSLWNDNCIARYISMCLKLYQIYDFLQKKKGHIFLIGSWFGTIYLSVTVVFIIKICGI